MSSRILVHCFLVSLAASIITPIFTFTTFIPEEGEAVYEFTENDQEKMEDMTPAEISDYLQHNIKTRKVTGFERFTYVFKQPHIVPIYLRASLLMFVPIFGATMVTSLLNSRYKGKISTQSEI